MKFLLNLILVLFFFNSAIAENHLKFFINSALKYNLKLNAERKNQKSIKQNINISRSEFLPSISLSGDQSSSQSSSKTDYSGSNLPDSSLSLLPTHTLFRRGVNGRRGRGRGHAGLTKRTDGTYRATTLPMLSSKSLSLPVYV